MKKYSLIFGALFLTASVMAEQPTFSMDPATQTHAGLIDCGGKSSPSAVGEIKSEDGKVWTVPTEGLFNQCGGKVLKSLDELDLNDVPVINSRHAQKENMFNIIYDNTEDHLAYIEIGEFEESFSIETDLSAQDLEAIWRNQVAKLLKKESEAVVLPAWIHSNNVRRGWVLYREGETVYIQERLFSVQGEHQLNLTPLLKRKIAGDNGEKISTWEIALKHLRAYANE